MSQPRVYGCVPLYRHLSPDVLISFMGLARSPIIVSWAFMQMPLIDLARNTAVERALASPKRPTHLFWIDADVIVPSDALPRLLAHDVPVACGIYPRKLAPYSPAVFQFQPNPEDPDLPLLVDDNQDVTTPRQIGATGLGAALVRADVYTQMAAHFDDRMWHHASSLEQGAEGEDTYFFRRLHEMEVPVLCDPTVRFGHVRDQVLTIEDFLQTVQESPERPPTVVPGTDDP